MEDLPRALFGYISRGMSGWRVEDAISRGRGIAFGYVEHEIPKSYRPPDIIIIDDSGVAETLSWLKTFSPDTSPLSQFARVVSYSDWERFGQSRLFAPPTRVREDRWACLVLGELIARGENVEMKSLPLSWSASCFSTAVARANILYSMEDARHICFDRLRVLEKDQRFARRNVSIAALEPVWSLASSRSDELVELPEIVDMVMSAVFRMADRAPASEFRISNFFSFKDDLTSDSIEKRVVAFQRLTGELGAELGDHCLAA